MDVQRETFGVKVMKDDIAKLLLTLTEKEALLAAASDIVEDMIRDPDASYLMRKEALQQNAFHFEDVMRLRKEINYLKYMCECVDKNLIPRNPVGNMQRMLYDRYYMKCFPELVDSDTEVDDPEVIDLTTESPPKLRRLNNAPVVVNITYADGTKEQLSTSDIHVDDNTCCSNVTCNQA